MNIKSILHPFVVWNRSRQDEKRKTKYIETDYSLKIKKYKDINAGKRCFIIGNGPSLKLSDLDRLAGEECFACNRIYGLYDKTEWRPKYYCSQDKKVLEQIKDDLEFAADNCEQVFLPYNYMEIYSKDLLDKTNLNLFYHPYISVYSRDGNYPEGLIPFSDDISRQIYDGLSITYGMMQIAAYMGYNEIYLIGIDHNYPMKNGVVDARQSYADGIKPIDMTTQFPPELLLCEVSFREAKRYFEQNGIIIRNATRGGRLEVFERASFDELVST